MADNLTGKVKEFILFAPRGALSLVRDTMPTVVSLLVSRGKLEDAQSAANNPDSAPQSLEDKSLVQKRLDSYTSDIQRSRDILYSSLGALNIFKKNLPTIQAVTSAKGKEVANQNIEATKKSFFRKVGDKIKNPVIEAEVIEEPPAEENLAHNVINGGVSITRSAVGLTLGAAQSCVGKVATFLGSHGEPTKQTQDQPKK